MTPRNSVLRRVFAGDPVHVIAAVALDVLVVGAAFVMALLLRFDGELPRDNVVFLLQALPLIALAFVGANLAFGVYRTVWSYGGVGDILTLLRPVASVTALLFASQLLLDERELPLSVILIAGALIFPGMAMVKMRTRLLARVPWAAVASQRLLIVGAGRTGQLLARELQNTPELTYQPVGYVDDDQRTLHMRIHGLRVFGPVAELAEVIEERAVDLVAIALDAPTGPGVREIVATCQELDVPVRIVPAMGGWVERPPSHDHHLRELTIEDLVGRKAVEVDYEACATSVRGKSVLVTGAAGSIGSELCRQLLQFGPRELHLFDNNETGLFDLSLELRALAGGATVQLWIGDVADEERIRTVFEGARPEAVYHAAALKHVPMLEEHPSEGLRVNVLGTQRLAEEARRQGVATFVLISTDKAVGPASAYGASKRIAELLVLGMGATGGGTAFSVVRFGNVMGSRGSVVPIFLRQIEAGGPVTVMHAAMERYFISIPEAVALVIQAGTYGGNGDIYMLDMGDPINIRELAERMIRLRGLRPGHDIAIEFTGPRPGEKLREQLVADFEATEVTEHPKIMRVAANVTVTETEMGRLVGEMAACAGDTDELRRRLFLVVRRFSGPAESELETGSAPFTNSPG